MNELILEWMEAGQPLSFAIADSRVRIGRDPDRADLILSHPTVSGLHVEIFFNPSRQHFYLRNLRETNPPIVDGQRIIEGEVALHRDSVIYLGQQLIKVTEVSIESEDLIVTYGLKCPNPRCDRVVGYDRLELGCPWCGTSLAAAASTIMPRSNDQS